MGNPHIEVSGDPIPQEVLDYCTSVTTTEREFAREKQAYLDFCERYPSAASSAVFCSFKDIKELSGRDAFLSCGRWKPDASAHSGGQMSRSLWTS